MNMTTPFRGTVLSTLDEPVAQVAGQYLWVDGTIRNSLLDGATVISASVPELVHTNLLATFCFRLSSLTGTQKAVSDHALLSHLDWDFAHHTVNASIHPQGAVAGFDNGGNATSIGPSASNQVMIEFAGSLAFGQVATGGITDAAVTAAKLDLTMSPTWTGAHTWTPAARTSGAAAYFTITAPTDTNLTATSEAIGINIVGATRQHATGAITTQREIVVGAPTYSFVGASTITTAVTFEISGCPIAGTSATLTNRIAQRIFFLNSGDRGLVISCNGGNSGVNNALEIRNVNDSVGFAVDRGGSITMAASASISNINGGIGILSTGGNASACQVGGAGTNRVGNAFFSHVNSAENVRLTANVTNATATFSNLTDLTETLVAGGKYTGRLVLKCNNTTAAEGIQLDFNGGSATMTNFWAAMGVLASSGTDTIGTAISTSLAGVLNYTLLTGETVIVIEISLVCANAGTFIPRFAENTTATGTLTAELGSYLWLPTSSN